MWSPDRVVRLAEVHSPVYFAAPSRRRGTGPEGSRSSGAIDGVVRIPDWSSWHHEYDESGSSLSRRLALVRAHIAGVLRDRAGQRTRVLSACAGEGRDIIAETAAAGDPDSVEALLVEKAPSVASVARESARRRGLRRFTVLEGDAGVTDAYASIVPADLLLFCGVFGWIDERDMFGTIDALPRLAAPGATVIWTRHYREPDATGAVRSRFARAGFDEVAFTKLPASVSAVGVHCLSGRPLPFEPGKPLFDFAAAPR
jgi:hypothetical protein